MNISELMKKMIEYSEGNLHDINHFIKVWTYAKTIGELEKIDEDTLFILEAAAITHDIACPLCRKKYGSTNGKYQELEGGILVRDLLKDCGLSVGQIDRIAYLVEHHHTYDNIDSMDYQILLEADYIINADESSYSKQNITEFCKKVFRTESGITLLKSIYGIA
ncbi:MAG: HD domain-containing protein [Oscillospiraceae bacterium]|nr:HD domain-containing protein [Oscillospiraceae bacterium]